MIVLIAVLLSSYTMMLEVPEEFIVANSVIRVSPVALIFSVCVICTVEEEVIPTVLVTVIVCIPIPICVRMFPAT